MVSSLLVTMMRVENTDQKIRSFRSVRSRSGFNGSLRVSFTLLDSCFICDLSFFAFCRREDEREEETTMENHINHTSHSNTTHTSIYHCKCGR